MEQFLNVWYNANMHKNRKPIIISIAIACSIIIAICLGLWVNKSFYSKELIYSTAYGFAFGSRRVQIYDNGEVYDDLEIEEPNHRIDYKYVKTLTREQIYELKEKENGGASEEELSNFVIELVYGVKKFDDMGGY